MTVHEQLLAEIKARKQAQTLFGEGIITADRYVKTVLDCVGSDICYRYATNKQTSFDDVLKRAAKTLVHRNEDMKLESDPFTQASDFKSLIGDGPEELEMPKNTLMAFKHCLTTPRKDRDGDILRTEGAIPDPKMLMLWQHIHTLPIGKMLMIAGHDAQKLSLVSAIVDMNDLSHDAAVMVDNDMARFSHGFRALEFEELKSDDDDKNAFPGWDVKSFEIMEESVVSVPSNADADVEEVILGLVEGERLTSGLMKEYGAQIRQKRPTRIAVTDQMGDYKRTVEADTPESLAEAVKALDDEKQRTGQEAGCGKGCGCGRDKPGASEQEDGNDKGEGSSEEKSEDAKVELTVKDAIAFVMANADRSDLEKMARIIQDQKSADEKKQTRERFRKFLRS